MLLIGKGFAGSPVSKTGKDGREFYTVDIFQQGQKVETLACSKDVYQKVEMFKEYRFTVEYAKQEFNGKVFSSFRVVDAVPTSSS